MSLHLAEHPLYNVILLIRTTVANTIWSDSSLDNSIIMEECVVHIVEREGHFAFSTGCNHMPNKTYILLNGLIHFKVIWSFQFCCPCYNINADWQTTNVQYCSQSSGTFSRAHLIQCQDYIKVCLHIENWRNMFTYC